MKKTTPAITVIALIVLTAIVSGCGNDSTLPLSADVTRDDALSLEDLLKTLDAMPVGEPSEDEIADLLLLREEEKLARDVYIVLGEQYDLSIFANISESEQQHMDAVKRLLDRFGLEDPVGDNGLGEFGNEELQTLYDGLIADGQQSLEGALLAGLAIEEIDILDLQHAMERAVLPEILIVFGNLCDGSENHLRAFAEVYESKIGEVYEPRWLTQDAYDQILCEEHGGNANGGSDR